MTIPTTFECMGSTVTVSVTADIEEKSVGRYIPQKLLILVDNKQPKQLQEQTFWHEFMHCTLDHLGYKDLDENEQFVDQMAQCLYQLQKTRKR